jgi:endonuclease YncB( thermonuclease family)
VGTVTPYEYQGTLVRVIDGDTVVLRLEKSYTQDVDFGFYIVDQMVLKKSTTMHFRLKGINTPELNATDPAVRQKAQEAKARVEDLLTGVPLRVLTYKPDKFGRWLADIFVPSEGGEIHVNQLLITEGLAVPYMVGQ